MAFDLSFNWNLERINYMQFALHAFEYENKAEKINTNNSSEM